MVKVCLFFRPNRAFCKRIADHRETFRRLEQGIRERLCIYRRDHWDIMHFFPDWPASAVWPQQCSARGTEPVFFDSIENIHLECVEAVLRHRHPSKAKIALLGVADTASIQALNAHVCDLPADIETDPIGFLFADRFIDVDGVGEACLE